MTLEQAKELFAYEYSYTQDQLDSKVYKIYTDFKLELEAEYQRGKEDVLSRSCENCLLFRPSDKACFLNSQNVYIRPVCISFSGCGKWERK